ncbi:uncharacterized protein LOC6558499 isoform X2 [Drosophila grimshawi]|uniref:GH16537 n=2 Tax=Drosophila grimshawi TaxID=7222 RepID=B4J154_DROGR|nr:uncharacterized protein LOC6558499 isoform X2 [Drosophila grimshawi]XP_043071288.1 uncharacterized protein LOC6558499 isoform X2 [Drosophila grimshawi]EDV96909.1 GH16537 [Drosophila grimshawi]
MLSSRQVSLLLSCLLLLLTAVQAQFLYHQTLGLPAKASYEPESPYVGFATADAHPSVVQNAQWESELPAELSKSARFFNDPVIAANLAKSSLLTSKEMAVQHREAEKIPREQVYKLFKNAGYLSRR